MKSKEEIKKFYHDTLKPELENLDEKIDKVNRRYSFKKYGIFLVFLLAATIFLYLQLKHHHAYRGDKDLGVKMFALFFFVALFFLIVLYVFRSIGYRPVKKAYMNLVVPKIVTFVNSSWNYFPEKGIRREDFDGTELFPVPNMSRNTRKFHSAGLITGKVNRVDFSAAYVHFYTVNESSSSKKDQRIHSIHKGLFAVIDVKTVFKSPLILKSKDHSIGEKIGQKITDFLGSDISKIFTGPTMNKVKTGNTDLDDLFDAQCMDNDCLVQLLNSGWPSFLIKIRLDYDMKFDSLFRDNKLYLAIDGLKYSDFGEWNSFVNESDSLALINQYNNFFGLLEEIDKM
ncbi:MAG: DUF3137 domain-containing protein [Crocinitomicaceae bacterium]|nr:DUF3137 domain-containing protein [Crocinitomicaceae bacterium]